MTILNQKTQTFLKRFIHLRTECLYIKYNFPQVKSYKDQPIIEIEKYDSKALIIKSFGDECYEKNIDVLSDVTVRKILEKLERKDKLLLKDDRYGYILKQDLEDIENNMFQVDDPSSLVYKTISDTEIFDRNKKSNQASATAPTYRKKVIKPPTVLEHIPYTPKHIGATIKIAGKILLENISEVEARSIDDSIMQYHSKEAAIESFVCPTGSDCGNLIIAIFMCENPTIVIRHLFFDVVLKTGIKFYGLPTSDMKLVLNDSGFFDNIRITRS